ncbi:MAG: hypothetical protein Q9227_009113 [Pyrenula ochraceoflavens]
MRFALCLVAFASIAAAVSVESFTKRQQFNPEFCTVNASAAFLAFSDQLLNQERSAGGATPDAAAVISVKTWYHIVAADMTAAGGYVSDDKVNQEHANLNKQYAGHGFQFVKQGITRTVNAGWSNDGPNAAQNMGTALRKGDYTVLNVYIVHNLQGDGTAGVCSLPQPSESKTNFDIADGCRIKSDTLPDSGYANVLVHETGHWLGLLHVFQESGNCQDDTGDKIDDTPKTLVDTECTARDSCPGFPGSDPIHNYMNYVPTSCMSVFTAGQTKRMNNFWTVRNQAP